MRSFFPGTAAVLCCASAPDLQQEIWLIGMVKGYLPYSGVASSRQTGRPRVTFEENSGLAGVIPVDEIDRAMAGHMRGTER